MMVKCINNADGTLDLTTGEIYKVIREGDLLGEKSVTVINDYGIKQPYYLRRFEIVEYDKTIIPSQPWTKETVFKTYCNDNLYGLSLGILEQMRDCLDNIIDNKKEIEL